MDLPHSRSTLSIVWLFRCFSIQSWILSISCRLWMSRCLRSPIDSEWKHLLFIFMLLLRFGYYVHGKSVHGRADTDMLDLQNCLRREANGQTGTRGLEPGQDITVRLIYYQKTLKWSFRLSKSKLPMSSASTTTHFIAQPWLVTRWALLMRTNRTSLK